MKPYYETLKVLETATQDEIKQSYHDLSREFHPDKGGDKEEMQRVNEAYSVLGDPEKRACYDQYGTIDKPIDTDEEARVQVLNAFRGAIKMDQNIEDFFKLVHISIQGVLDDVISKKRVLEFDIDLAKQKKRRLISFRNQKVKKGMDILKQAFNDEITEVESTISRLDPKVFDREIETLGKAKKILDKSYPKETIPENFPPDVREFFRIESTHGHSGLSGAFRKKY